MLVGAVRRLGGQGGDPVVQLQTNFGGGKTHSMLALYHLFSGISPAELVGIDAVLTEAGDQQPARPPGAWSWSATRSRPATPSRSPTALSSAPSGVSWPGSSAGKKAFARIQADDEKATSPGDVLRELFNRVRPVPDPDRRVGRLCAPAPRPERSARRRLRDPVHLRPGRSPSRPSSPKNCLLVISLPASDTAGSPHTQADDVEVGGQRGREALDRLRNVVGRVESSWRPASAEEGFEIVRRRLFEPHGRPEQFKDRDVVARAFADLYRTQHQEFPPECRDADYEKRIKAAYPIHPEIFDRLYTDWSTLVKFQRTRGVLRLMAAVIHSLWEKGDKNPLILPANIPIDDPRVQFELTRYLSDNWVPVIEKDVDGPTRCRCASTARSPTWASSPPAGGWRARSTSAPRPPPRPPIAGSKTGAQARLRDARRVAGRLRRCPATLAGAATYLYQDGPRYWYSTQPTVTKLADDRAEQLKRDPDKVVAGARPAPARRPAQRGDFSRVHPLPQSGADVPDDLDARLVVLRVDHPYSKEPDNAAEVAAKAIFESRGNTPRLYRNTLVFLAADKTRLQDLDEAVRKYLAWESILAEKDASTSTRSR